MTKTQITIKPRAKAPLPAHLRAEAERIARTYPNGDTKRAPLPAHLRNR